jgi:hypothetical protein
MAEPTQYQSAVVLSGKLPSWVSDQLDQERMASYDVYDDMFDNNPDTYALMLRGVDDNPIYVPTAKTVIKAMSRYVARGFGYAVPQTKGTPEQQTLATVAYGEWFKREEILSKMTIGKQALLRRGDLFWYLYADSSKPEGQRVSCRTLDPRTVFKITDDNDVNKVTGYTMVEHMQVGDKVAIKRQRWLRYTHPEHPAYDETGLYQDAPIAYDSIILEADGWDKENPKVVQKVIDLMLLAPEITQLPIYHMKNGADDSQAYGNSELKGLESIIAAVNQGASDQDIALAMAGLGMYKTSSGGPVGDDGVSESDWVIGPGRVMEDETFERVNGVATVSPSMDHINFLSDSVDAALGVTSVTRGDVQAAVAESGIALAIRMSPTLDMADEKDLVIKDTFDHLLFDMKSWFKAFEGWDFSEVDIVTAFGDKLPVDRAARIQELTNLLTAGVISVAYFQSVLADQFGFKFPETMMDDIAADAQRANAAADPFGARLAQDAGTLDTSGGTPPGA